MDIPEPSPGPGEVRVRVEAAAFNRLDRFVLEGIPGVEIERPHVLGSDGAGRVDRLGAGVDDLSEGRRVLLNPGMWDGICPACLAHDEALCRQYRIIGEHTQGTAVPYIVVPRRNVHSIPRDVPTPVAAAAPLVFQTAWRAVRSVGALRAGETFAVIGAGGGVATAAIQVAKLTGARVLVVSRHAEKAERARRLGADEVLVFDEAHPIDKLLWEWSGKRGVDVVFDSVGAPTLPRSVRALARGGRLVVIGATAGPVAAIDVRTLFWRQASIRGSTMASASEFEEMLAALGRGELKPVVDREFAFGDAKDAFARLDAPDLFGKVVLRLE